MNVDKVQGAHVSDIQHMPIAEFRAEGYIAEINRQLLHPLGLALEVARPDVEELEPAARAVLFERFPDLARTSAALAEAAGRGENVEEEMEAWRQLATERAYKYGLLQERISGVWDYRGDAEGIYYGGDAEYWADLARKAERVQRLWNERLPARVEALGFMVQPVDSHEYEIVDSREESAAEFFGDSASAGVGPDERPSEAEINARRTHEVTEADDELREAQTLLAKWQDDSIPAPAGMRRALLQKVSNARGKLAEWREEGE